MAHQSKSNSQSKPTHNGKRDMLAAVRRRHYCSKAVSSGLVRFVTFLLLVANLGPQRALFAQTDLGSITGTIRDNSDAAVPN
jgi:hypothetical protein